MIYFKEFFFNLYFNTAVLCLNEGMFDLAPTDKKVLANKSEAFRRQICHFD